MNSLRRRRLGCWRFYLALAAGLVVVAAASQGIAAEPGRHNPVPRDEASIRDGRAVYMKECQSCHGRRGRGDGPGARHLNVAVPDLTSADVRSETDGKWFDSITKGSKPMPAYRRRLSERQRWDVVNY